MLFKHFMFTVYQTFHVECFKTIPIITIISPAIFQMFKRAFPVTQSFLSYLTKMKLLNNGRLVQK